MYPRNFNRLFPILITTFLLPFSLKGFCLHIPSILLSASFYRIRLLLHHFSSSRWGDDEEFIPIYGTCYFIFLVHCLISHYSSSVKTLPRYLSFCVGLIFRFSNYTAYVGLNLLADNQNTVLLPAPSFVAAFLDYRLQKSLEFQFFVCYQSNNICVSYVPGECAKNHKKTTVKFTAHHIPQHSPHRTSNPKKIMLTKRWLPII